jgi:hypothetical protein
VKEKSIFWSDCVESCTDAARVVVGNKRLKVLIKRPASDLCGHCGTHRESLVTKELCPELSEAMDTLIRTANCIKARPLKSRLFAQLCEEIGAQYQWLLFYCNSRWLSKGNIVVRVGRLREIAMPVLEEEDLIYAEHFRNESFS